MKKINTHVLVALCVALLSIQNVEGSEFPVPKKRLYIIHSYHLAISLVEEGVKKVVISSGEYAEDLRRDPSCQLADGISKEKVPRNLHQFLD
ncbi:MAG: hypothetical protein A3I05_09175 [Deltaproteobacteria bacterium RIFCSPLOWO2_02_FULL_44_10]|nr:MAG: hypothetical protein A3C46_07805 [Deltaproteobacteria bacterium RIFCSPHIGHO2_02_FULL_44_16]OGQ47390.1 MAG: hypothetical protein A3I05_09175 [Deltaproteobacteria bacterium RIFCSPLOWO2_02_FULL_44_10]